MLAFFALQARPYLYAFLLFDVIFSNDILRNLMKAVTKPAKQLMYTASLVFIVVYAFALVAFFIFGGDFLSFRLENDTLSFFYTTVYDIMVPGPAMSIGSMQQ